MFAVGKPSHPGFHTLENLAIGQPLPLLSSPWLRGQQLLGALAHLCRGQQFSGGKHHKLLQIYCRALIGYRELRQTLNLVPPKVDPNRHICSSWEHVNNRAANGNFTPVFHLIFTPIPTENKLLDQRERIDLIAKSDSNGFNVFNLRAESLNQCSSGGNNDR
ncbi:unannotated protein [freshwater metagenome]|uniref:Unannotated protein n=1 Tax=freshwater metagenome TaxID=449393 RepID=A0A6J6B576_9ZZZZ